MVDIRLYSWRRGEPVGLHISWERPQGRPSSIMPAKAGIQKLPKLLDSRLRGHDK